MFMLFLQVVQSYKKSSELFTKKYFFNYKGFLHSAVHGKVKTTQKNVIAPPKIIKYQDLIDDSTIRNQRSCYISYLLDFYFLKPKKKFSFSI